MKKGISVFLIFTCIMCLSSCGLMTYKQNEWLPIEKLEKCLVPDLPVIDRGDYYSNGNTGVYFNTKGQELADYAAEVFAYLKSQNFEYLGTRGHQKASLAGAFASYYFKEIESFEDCYTQMYSMNYVFVYSDGTVNENGHMAFHEIIIADFDKKAIRVHGDDIDCNSKIQLNYDAHYYLEECDDKKHIWEEKSYDLPGGAYVRCSICGKMEQVTQNSDEP